MKKLYKSRDNKVLWGVMGGAGEYFDLDPVLLRLAWIALSVLTGFIPGIIGYIVAALIVPQKPKA